MEMLRDNEAWYLAEILLTNAPAREDDRRELVNQLRTLSGDHADKVGEFLASIRNRHERVTANLDEVTRRQQSAWNHLSAIRRHRQIDRDFILRLVDQMPTAEQIDKDGGEAFAWYGFIARAGILAGYPHDAERLLRQIAQDGFASAETAWENTSERLTTNGEYPTPVSIEEAVEGAYGHLTTHPLEPRFAEFWQWVWQVAKTGTALCGVFDEMAKVLGLPEEWAPTRDGWFILSGTWSVRMYADEVPVDDVPDFDPSDILNELSWDDMTIDEIEED